MGSSYCCYEANDNRKYEHSNTFGLVTSATSNVVWAADDEVRQPVARSIGAGKVVAGAGEEVLCWDIKKGELLSRWRDSKCSAEITAILCSTVDHDIYAVG